MIDGWVVFGVVATIGIVLGVGGVMAIHWWLD